MVMAVVLLPLQTRTTAMKSSSARRRRISSTFTSTSRSRRFVCLSLFSCDSKGWSPRSWFLFCSHSFGRSKVWLRCVQVLLELTRQAHQEKTVLSLSVCQLGAEGKKRSFDLSVTSYLRRVLLDYCDVPGNGRTLVFSFCSHQPEGKGSPVRSTRAPPKAASPSNPFFFSVRRQESSSYPLVPPAEL